MQRARSPKLLHEIPPDFPRLSSLRIHPRACAAAAALAQTSKWPCAAFRAGKRQPAVAHRAAAGGLERSNRYCLAHAAVPPPRTPARFTHLLRAARTGSSLSKCLRPSVRAAVRLVREDLSAQGNRRAFRRSASKGARFPGLASRGSPRRAGSGWERYPPKVPRADARHAGRRFPCVGPWPGASGRDSSRRSIPDLIRRP